MTACKSVEPNELTKSSIVGVAEGDGDGVVNDFDEVGDRPGKAGVDEAGEGDWARRFAAKIDIVKFANKNRVITLIRRCYQ